jgi:hypothetical protein
MHGARLTAGLLIGLGMALAAGACSSESESASNGTGGTTGSGGGAGLGGGGTGGAALSCTDSSSCGPGSFCSVTKLCVPNGQCGADGDCTSGTFCSGDRTCIPVGTCKLELDCAEGETCDAASNQCVPGGGCGAEPFEIEAVVPNMFISLDRSCSMNNTAAVTTKWMIAVQALTTLTTTYTGKVRWGLGLFPDTLTPNCQQGPPALPVGDNNEAPIQTLLNNALAKADPNFPDGPCVTNIDTAMKQASEEPAFADPSRPSYVLLITDGNQAGCSAAGGDAGTTQIITDLLSAGVPTFVIGFGKGIDPVQMNVFADAGGVPNNDPTTRYYKADDQPSLDAALASIAGKIANCSFALQGVPPDPDKLFAFFDKVGIPRDPTHQAGWDYDPATNTITFYGQDCQDLKDGKVGKVDVVFGCNQPPLQ